MGRDMSDAQVFLPIALVPSVISRPCRRGIGELSGSNCESPACLHPVARSARKVQFSLVIKWTFVPRLPLIVDSAAYISTFT
jgi:hypothetical protein